MRNMSFALTTAQFLNGSKTVTRRLGWANARVGDIVMAIEKGQGLKKGERVNPLGRIRFTHVSRVPLNGPTLTFDDVSREGFHGQGPSDFVAMFTKHNGCHMGAEVTRIEFEHLCAQLSCRYPVSEPGLCGECSCEDDGAIW